MKTFKIAPAVLLGLVAIASPASAAEISCRPPKAEPVQGAVRRTVKFEVPITKDTASPAPCRGPWSSRATRALLAGRSV